jgi:hypothetical protein
MEALMPAKKSETAKAEAKPKKDTLTCMVLKAGDGKISKGERDANSDIYYDRHDKPEFPVEIARALQERGFVEIMDD